MIDDNAFAPPSTRRLPVHRAGLAEQLQTIEDQIRSLEFHTADRARPTVIVHRPLAALSAAQLLALGFIAEGAGDYGADDPLPATLSGLGLVECADGAWRLTGLGRSVLRHQT